MTPRNAALDALEQIDRVKATLEQCTIMVYFKNGNQTDPPAPGTIQRVVLTMGGFEIEKWIKSAIEALKSPSGWQDIATAPMGERLEGCPTEELTTQSKIEPVYKLVGKRVKEIREFLGWSQEELAERLGLSRPTIANIEVGRQRMMLHDIEKICLCFNMTYQKFMKGIWFINGRKV